MVSESHKPDQGDEAARGASGAAIRHHYDRGNAFFRLWLDNSMTYSCALWDDANKNDTLEAAQWRKIDWHIDQAGAKNATRVLDIGCGWGSTLTRLVNSHVVALRSLAIDADRRMRADLQILWMERSLYLMASNRRMANVA